MSLLWRLYGQHPKEKIIFNKPNNNNNMKQITLCLLLAVCGLLVPSALRAQSPANEIVRLHNGTEITGTVERQQALVREI